MFEVPINIHCLVSAASGVGSESLLNVLITGRLYIAVSYLHFDISKASFSQVLITIAAIISVSLRLYPLKTETSDLMAKFNEWKTTSVLSSSCSLLTVGPETSQTAV